MPCHQMHRCQFYLISLSLWVYLLNKLLCAWAMLCTSFIFPDRQSFLSAGQNSFWCHDIALPSQIILLQSSLTSEGSVVAYFVMATFLCCWWKSLATMIAATYPTISLVISLQACCSANVCTYPHPCGYWNDSGASISTGKCGAGFLEVTKIMVSSFEKRTSMNLPEVRDSDLSCCDHGTKVLK